jgi:hypothetical protein
MHKRYFVRSAAAMMFLALPAFMLASGSASAALTNGPVTLSPASGATAGTPYASGQTITVTVAANSTLSQAAGVTPPIKWVECAAPGGVDPTTPTNNCDGITASSTTSVNADGSMTFSTTVYALPDPNLGEASTAKPACGLAPNYCVLYIGTNQNNFADPMLWSSPFQVAADPSDAATNPGDGTPESPLPILLPLLGVAVAGGAFFTIRRRRRIA